MFLRGTQFEALLSSCDQVLIRTDPYHWACFNTRSFLSAYPTGTAEPSASRPLGDALEPARVRDRHDAV
jgi:hypothetical protein